MLKSVRCNSPKHCFQPKTPVRLSKESVWRDHSASAVAWEHPQPAIGNCEYSPFRTGARAAVPACHLRAPPAALKSPCHYSIRISNLMASVPCCHKHCIEVPLACRWRCVHNRGAAGFVLRDYNCICRAFSLSLCLGLGYETSPPKKIHRIFLPHRLRLHGKVLLAYLY